jgi:hypothetical protein
MYSPEQVKLHLELWQTLTDGERIAGHVVLVIQKKDFWKMLKLLSEGIDSNLRNKEPLESFFETLRFSLKDPFEKKVFRWSQNDYNADLWIQIRKVPKESRIYCSDNGRESWGQVIAQNDTRGLAAYKPLQCALADHLLDDELLQKMLPGDLLDYERLSRSLTER